MNEHKLPSRIWCEDCFAVTVTKVHGDREHDGPAVQLCPKHAATDALLAALKALTAAMEDSAGVGCGDWSVAEERDIEQARAAIALAEGNP